MNKAPAFQFYPDKWLAATGHLSDGAYRAYHRLICWMWLNSPDQCSIPDDLDVIAVALCERNANALQAHYDEIMRTHCELLKRTHGRLVSGGLQKEAKKQVERRAKASSSAKSRWNNELHAMRTQCERNANASFEQCSPSPSPSPTPYTTINTPISSSGEENSTDVPDSSGQPVNSVNVYNGSARPQSAKEVQKYAESLGYHIDGQEFIDYYAMRGWQVKGADMQDWRAAVRQWKRNNKKPERTAKPKLNVIAESAPVQLEAGMKTTMRALQDKIDAAKTDAERWAIICMPRSVEQCQALERYCKAKHPEFRRPQAKAGSNKENRR